MPLRAHEHPPGVVLTLTRDAGLADRLAALGVTAGVELLPLPSLAAARAHPAAALLLLGADLLLDSTSADNGWPALALPAVDPETSGGPCPDACTGFPVAGLYPAAHVGADLQPLDAPPGEVSPPALVAGPGAVRMSAMTRAWADPDLPRSRVGPSVVVVTEQGDDDRIWRAALEAGADRVAVLPGAEPWLLDLLVDAVTSVTPSGVIAVTAARGGAGASTTATVLSTTAARCGLRTALVDCDPSGGGLELLLGLEAEPGMRWPDLATARGRLQPGLLTARLPTADGVWVLSWPGGSGAEAREVPVPALDAVVRAARREFDLVVVDVPRWSAATQRWIVPRCRCLVFLVPAEIRAVAAAQRALDSLRELTTDIRLAVRGPAPTGLPAEAVAEALRLPLSGRLRHEPVVAASSDRGELPVLHRGPLVSFCRSLLAEVAG